MATKDYSLLAEQPLSAADLKQREQAEIVISAITTDTGERLVVSRYGDDTWHLWPFLDQSNRAQSEEFIDWTRMHTEFRDVAKAVLYRYWMVGRPGSTRPNAITLRGAFFELAAFFRYLHDSGIRSLGEVRPLHVANYVHSRKRSGGVGKSALTRNLLCVELLYVFGDQHPDGLRFEPWGDSAAQETAGYVGAARAKAVRDARTPLIPPPVVATLFTSAEAILEGANRLLDERDAGMRSPLRDPSLMLVRDACFFLLGILTGMRCEELVGIDVGAGRTEVKDGFVYNWIKSVEHKTKKGQVEYLVASMGLEVLRILERWSEPHRRRLAIELAALESDTRAKGLAQRARRIHALRKNRNRLFLSGAGVQTISGRTWGTYLKRFSARAGVRWNLAPHQLRRTYAWTFVRHKLGNLLLLREQFKHSSIEMSQLYAANPMQDETLYDECLNEFYEYKVEVVQTWLHDGEPLSGGAGKKIVVMRAHAFPNRAALIKETADKVSIRSTGHSWCLSQHATGCGGQGLYERSQCGPCGSSVIDRSFAPIWQEMFDHQRELKSIASEMGPGAVQRVERDLARARSVLTDLGAMLVEGRV
ncbi:MULTISPECIES: tyrosine-type recombinase/integrase [unclassified Variovorax]|uniref:tyrosine-type recombinase/integrase n=1 Tax=unclassified Variovorax TaxID=663243 RepID=UPI003ECF75D5